MPELCEWHLGHKIEHGFNYSRGTQDYENVLEKYRAAWKTKPLVDMEQLEQRDRKIMALTAIAKASLQRELEEYQATVESLDIEPQKLVRAKMADLKDKIAQLG
jgi:hypothetical protein